MIRKLLSLAVLLTAVALPAFAADTYKFEPDHTSVTFTYPHFGLSHPSGKIMGAAGTLALDWDDPVNCQVDVTLDMTTLTTALPLFDAMLKGDGYFDVKQFPTATFKSTSIELLPPPADPNNPDADDAGKVKEARVTGDMTIHGVTQSVVLDVTFNRKAFNPALFKTGVGFSGVAHLSRKAFGLSAYEPFVGDEIDIDIEAEAY
ncbi:MAG: YceI family protein [Asticcacaulis sp.]